MTRLVPVTVLMMVLALSRVAGAQAMTTFPSGGTIVFEHRKIYDESKNDGSFREPDSGTPDLRRYFNLAHCNCAKANLSNPKSAGWFQYLIRETMNSGFGKVVPVSFFLGTSCDSSTNRPGGASPTCVGPLFTVGDLDQSLFVNGGNDYQSFNLFQAVNANQPSTTTSCFQTDSVSNSIFALVDSNLGTAYNYMGTQPVGGLSTDTGTASAVDTLPPPFPDSVSARGGDGTIHLAWKAPTQDAPDVAYYQALCAVNATSAADPALSQPSGDPQYVTTTSVCGANGTPDTSETLMAIPVSDTTGEMPLTAAPAGAFGALEKKFVCATSSTGTATSLDIGGLTNGVQYQVILLSVDLHGNYRGAYFTSTLTPIPSTDFWEDLHDRGSKTQGGLCLLAETYGDDSALTGALRAFRDDTLGGSRAGRWLTELYYATLARLGPYVHGSSVLRVVAAALLAPVVAVALLWYWLTLPGMLGLAAAAWSWRHRRRFAARLARVLGTRAARVATVLVVLALGARPAHAGNGYQPYWENGDAVTSNDAAPATAAPDAVNWHVGIRVGPYVPDIDKQLGMSPGPYQQMFGGYRVLPMLDVDRILWSEFGQIGVGISVGYMQKTARAFTLSSDPSSTDRARSSDHNAFRMLPLALTATYRFTYLDDVYGIPLVPYARAGFSYYLWSITVDNGDFAKVCSDGGTEPMCSQNKAYGASLGVQGSIGLSIRAERIDASTAMSMRQSGIQHAGIYGEISLAKVDGFGSDKKLSVGDRTWFAGIDFEF